MDLPVQIQEIRERNQRVEADKAWETSWIRRSLIAVLTYAIVVLFFFAAELPNPFINALVPCAGFVLSTLSLSVVKNWWVKWFYQRNHE